MPFLWVVKIHLQHQKNQCRQQALHHNANILEEEEDKMPINFVTKVHFRIGKKLKHFDLKHYKD